MCVEGLYRIYTPPSILDIISLAPVSALYNKMIYWSMLHFNFWSINMTITMYSSWGKKSYTCTN